MKVFQKAKFVLKTILPHLHRCMERLWWQEKNSLKEIDQRVLFEIANGNRRRIQNDPDFPLGIDGIQKSVKRIKENLKVSSLEHAVAVAVSRGMIEIH